jgi:hypothetical protein
VNRRLCYCLPALLALLLPTGCTRRLPPDVSANTENVDKLRSLARSPAGSGAAAPITANPTGFATFTGLVKVTGQPPVMPPVSVSGNDATYCAPNGRAPISDEVVVGPDGGLANVLVYVDMDLPEEWEHPDDAALRTATLSGPQGFDQRGCMFVSHVFAMRSTQTVELINSDGVAHNTNINANGKAGSSNSLIPANLSDKYTPGGQSRGVFPVSCNIHTWMKAYMITRDNPYFAVTDKNGKFEIRNVPAGVNLDFRIWQERVGTGWRNVTVNGAPAEWSRGKFTLNLQPNATENWEVVVDASILNK